MEENAESSEKPSYPRGVMRTTLSVKLENIRIGTSLNILVTQAYRYFCARNMSPKNNADLSRTVKNRVLVSNQSSLPSWGQASRYVF